MRKRREKGAKEKEGETEGKTDRLFSPVPLSVLSATPYRTPASLRKSDILLLSGGPGSESLVSHRSALARTAVVMIGILASAISRAN